MLKSVCNQIVQCPSESGGVAVSAEGEETKPGSKDYNPWSNVLGWLSLRQALSDCFSVDETQWNPLCSALVASP